MYSTETLSSQATVIEPAWLRAFMWIGCPLIGAGALIVLKLVANWILRLPWAPFQDPLKLLASGHATRSEVALSS